MSKDRVSMDSVSADSLPTQQSTQSVVQQSKLSAQAVSFVPSHSSDAGSSTKLTKPRSATDQPPHVNQYYNHQRLRQQAAGRRLRPPMPYFVGTPAAVASGFPASPDGSQIPLNSMTGVRPIVNPLSFVNVPASGCFATYGSPYQYHHDLSVFPSPGSEVWHTSNTGFDSPEFQTQSPSSFNAARDYGLATSSPAQPQPCVLSPGSTTSHEYRFAPGQSSAGILAIGEKKKFRRKNENEPRCHKERGLDRISIGVQYETEERRQMEEVAKNSRHTMTTNYTECAVQTDFSDEVAGSLLADLPSTLYNNDDVSLEAVDGSSIDSDELDSDSGYSSMRHRGLVVINECCCRNGAGHSKLAPTRQLDPGWVQHHDNITYQTPAPATNVMMAPQNYFRPPLPPVLIQSNPGFSAPVVGYPNVEVGAAVLPEVFYGFPDPSVTGSLTTSTRDNVGCRHVIEVNDAGTGTHVSRLSAPNCNPADRRQHQSRPPTLPIFQSAVVEQPPPEVAHRQTTGGTLINDACTVTKRGVTSQTTPKTQENKSALAERKEAVKLAKKTRRRGVQLSRAADSELEQIALQQKTLADKYLLGGAENVTRSSSTANDECCERFNEQSPASGSTAELSTHGSVGSQVESSAMDGHVTSFTPTPSVSQPFVNQTEKPETHGVVSAIHGQFFREYCDHLLTKEIDECCHEMLQCLVQLSQCSNNDVTAKQPQGTAKRRLVFGLREVPKHLRLRELECLIISPNVERIQAKGGLDDVINGLIQSSRQMNVPVVFALSRKALGRACAKSVPISVVGIFNCEGVEVLMQRLLDLVQQARESYNKILHQLRYECVEEGNDDVTASISSPASCGATAVTGCHEADIQASADDSTVKERGTKCSPDETVVQSAYDKTEVEASSERIDSDCNTEFVDADVDAVSGPSSHTKKNGYNYGPETVAKQSNSTDVLESGNVMAAAANDLKLANGIAKCSINGIATSVRLLDAVSKDELNSKSDYFDECVREQRSGYQWTSHRDSPELVADSVC